MPVSLRLLTPGLLGACVLLGSGTLAEAGQREASVGSPTGLVGRAVLMVQGGSMVVEPGFAIVNGRTSSGAARLPAMCRAYLVPVGAVHGTATWTLAVSAERPNAEVTVSWALPRSLPHGVLVVLEDRRTGRSYDMRSCTCVSYRAGSASETRTLTISVRHDAAGGLRITDVSVLWGGGRASGGAAITFSVPSGASYVVEVLSAAGARVATVAIGTATAAGAVRLTWDGRDSTRQIAPPGAYLMQIRALGLDGEVVRSIQPFAVLR